MQIGNLDLESLVNSRAGLVSKLKEIKPLPEVPLINRYLAIINYKENSNVFTISGSGFSLNKQEAMISSVGEAIERYCAHIIDSNIKWSSYRNLQSNGDVLDPSLITRLTEEQYKNKYNQLPPDLNTKLGWSTCVDFQTGKDIFVPTEMIYLRKIQNPLIRDIISTGLACGPTKDNAIQNGLLECIERDSFMLFWLFLRANFKIDISSLDDNHEISKLYLLAKRFRLNVTLLDITTDLGIPSIVTILTKNGTSGFYMGCASHINYEQAIYKSLKEGIGGYSIYYESLYIHDTVIPRSADEIRTLDDHVLYYFAGNHDNILSDIDHGNKIVDAKHLLNTKNISLKSLKDFPIYYKNITSEDIKEIGVSVVRVVCPTLCYLPVGESFLSCQRIERFKVNYNKIELNLAPHPFP
ncbi:YcaO-like family protein [Sporosarcina sp. Marseille-Q4943]|uniref:YcaO-like family protein n=1 Tax=Sporosarcina sp. Marseille-Q4943 TaxID=2942204 RepID=UPI00208DAE8A|nr:YcaO-like family protein [Sporosarcina sp. Marseille-Q4943]